MLSPTLRGGDSRSLGQANRVAALILSQAERFPEAELLGLAAENQAARAERKGAVALLKEFLRDRNSIAKTCVL